MEPAITTTWTREKIEHMLAEEDMIYQKIQLPYGLNTEGNDRSGTSELIFEKDLSGKSIVDIGCWLGHFCIDATRRGADRVLGVDVNERRLRQARLIADCLGMQIDYRFLNIEQENLPEPFDIVLLLNVLHHLRNPINALDRLIPYVRDRLVIEFAGPQNSKSNKMLKKMGVPWWMRRGLNRLPIMVVSGEKVGRSDCEQKYFFTPSSLEHLLMSQRGSFARFEIMTSGYRNRFIAVAWKRRVDNLLLISSLPAAGRTTMVEQLKASEPHPLQNEIPWEPQKQWQHFTPDQLRTDRQVHIPAMLYDFDIHKPWSNNSRVFSSEPALDVLGCADRCTVVTLWCDPEVLIRRVEERRQHARDPQHLRRLDEILEVYRTPELLIRIYKDWIEFCRSRHAQLYFIDTTDQLQRISETQWQQKIQTIGRGGHF